MCQTNTPVYVPPICSKTAAENLRGQAEQAVNLSSTHAEHFDEKYCRIPSACFAHPERMCVEEGHVHQTFHRRLLAGVAQA